MKKPSCILCGKPLNSGIIINGIAICESCEKRLVGTEAGNDFYDYYINCIKKTIVHSLLKGADKSCQNFHL